MRALRRTLVGLALGLLVPGGAAWAKIHIHAPDGREVVQKEGTRQPDLSAYRSPLEAKIASRRWHTNDEMYLANEEFYSGIPFLLEAVKAGLPVAHNPQFEWVTGQEAYWYSRYKLSYFFAQSHAGISMIHGPYWTLKARQHYEKNRLQRDRGERVPSNKDILLGVYLPLYYKRTGWPRVFEDAAPTYLQYASADPHFTGEIVVEDDFEDPQSGKKGHWGVPRYFLDWRNTRWNHDAMEKVFDLGGIGQTTKKQLLWVEYMFKAEHMEQSPGDPGAEVSLLGNDAEEGFRGVSLTLAGFNALLELKTAMFADARGKKLGGLNPLTYDPAAGLRYVPHRIAPQILYVGDLPERVWALSIDDNSSRLWDQASWLWAAAEYEWLATQFEGKAFTDNPPVDGGIIEKKSVEVARGLSNVLVRNMAAMHRRKGVLVSTWTPGRGMGSTFSMEDAALAMVALRELKERRETADFSPEIRDLAEEMILAQAEFLLEVQGAEGSFYEGYEVSTGAGVGEQGLSTPQFFAIQALVAAYHTSEDMRYVEAAARTYDYLNRRFWDEASGLYRTRAGDDTVILTPRGVAAAMGALRELAFATPLHLVRPQIERYTRWFVQTVDNSGFTMSEDNRTGELSFGQQSPDEDGDGIPFLKYGHGRHGIAPVSAAEVVVNIGGPANKAFYRIKGDVHVPDRFAEVNYAYVRREGAMQALAPRLRGSALLASAALSPALVDGAQTLEREPMMRFNGTLIPLPPSRPIPRGSDFSGKEIYQLNCAVCHGDRGEGITGKALATIARKDAETIFAVPKKGRFELGMPPWGGGVDALAGVLSDEEIHRVVEYIRTELFEKSGQN